MTTGVAPLSAQDFSAILPAQYGPEYEGLLSDPGNLDRLFRLARRAETEAAESGAETGYRFAIRLYERMLLLDPSLTQVMLRLGEIHFRLQEYVEAGSYFRRALEAPDLPPEFRLLALRYVDEIERELSPSRFSGFVTFGMMYQSNPSLEDEPGLFPEPQGSDFNIYGSAGFTHVYDPGLQTGHTVETTLFMETQQYASLNELDNAAVDLSFGPRFRLDSYGIAKTSVRPYLLWNLDTLDGDWYAVETGVGVSVTRYQTEKLRLSANLSYFSKHHNTEQSDFVELDTLDGDQYRLRLSADYRVNAQLDLGVSVYFRRREYPDDNVFNVTDRHTNRRGLEFFLQYRHAPLIDFGAGDWLLNLSLSREEVSYITALSPGLGGDRDDQENKILLSSEIPFSPDSSIVAGVGYTDYNSTNEFGTYSNWEAFVGVIHRF